MNTSMLKRARHYFCHDLVSQDLARANMRKWVRAIRLLGNKWLLHPANKVNHG